MSLLNSINGTLGLRRAKHLLRRATFTYSKGQIDLLSNKTASEALDYLLLSIPNKINEPYDPQPTSNPDGYWLSSDKHPNEFEGQGRKRAHITAAWWYNAINQTSLKHKLTFFLHTSFTVGKDSGAGLSSHFYDHLRLLEQYAYGNIKALAKKITLDNSMLDYLDNTNNNANNPNENYGREYLELFTILKGPQKGEGDYTNYTEIDVQMAAKVFSGFRTQNDRKAIDEETTIPKGYARKNSHDKNDKNFSAAFGNHVISGRDTAEGMYEELDDFVEMVFAQEATAISYARKLYRFFVKSEWDEEIEATIILSLSQILIDNNFEIIPAIKALLCSTHFYDEDDSDNSNEIIGSIVKSPLQLLSEIITMFEVSFPNPETEAYRFYRNFFLSFIHNSYFGSAGLEFFNPDSVAGYPAIYQEPDFDRHWFSSTTIIARYKLIESLIFGKNTIISGNIYTSIDIISFVEKHIAQPSDAYELIKELSELLYPENIDDSRINYFIDQLVDGFDSYYWNKEWVAYTNTGEKETVKTRLNDLIIAMTNAPEFQLM
mgnify:FL=1